MPQYKDFDSGDIIAGKFKLKYFPAWTDVTTDVDTTQQAILNTFFVKAAQTGSIEGYYYWNIYEENPATVTDADPEFSIAYAHTGSIIAGNPAGVYSVNITGNSIGLGTEYQYIYPAWSLYRQLVNATTSTNAYTNLTYVSGTTTYTIANAYVVAIGKGRVKDYIDPNSWQLNLSGSTLVPLLAQTASATNQSEFNVTVGTLSGYPVSYGTPAAAVSALTQSNYAIGKFYPYRGLIILDADKLNVLGALSQSALLSGKPDASSYYTASLILNNFLGSMVGSKPTPSLALGALISSSATAYFKARSVERAQSSHYFVRVKNSEFNYTTNPTWFSGSNNTVLSVFADDPKTYITSVGLYDGNAGAEDGQMVAIGKLSKPVQKATDTEALLRLRLDF